MLQITSSIPQFKTLTLTSPFLHGGSSINRFKSCSSIAAPAAAPARLPVIKAMKTLQGIVVCSTNDKTVAVEVTRLAPHPKYKRRVRKKKTYQAHDPLNQFQVGDYVQLEKGRPISKTKSFWAIPVPSRRSSKGGDEDAPPPEQELGIPLESESSG
ncbi:30S ribosomal protein S17, chloroplastic [Andrographis paniculata]|uniref:30S ribosomal protein S17, chloroplastic n=1 Tax=Andrographis paniculata TaxID=175694 RepID=UPI0021E73041|nr:30S ribosomal protein S17, chloroplastic [Andrographis paniculata]